jgi:hypoxanthine phosphoribosyltransferase
MEQIIQVKDLRFKPFISEAEILTQVERMANEINHTYQGQTVHLVILLKGAFIFGADLVRHLNIDHTIQFVKLSSYDGLSSSGSIREEFGLAMDIKGKLILIVEDIVDTGTTLNYFFQKLLSAHPSSLHIASLLVKPDALKYDIPVKFRGFDIENKFVVGYGLDYDDAARNLRDIYQLAD